MNSNIMQPGINLNPSEVLMATSQMAHMSLAGGVPAQVPPTNIQTQLPANQIAGATGQQPSGHLPLQLQTQLPAGGQMPGTFQAAFPAAPTTLNVMQQQQQQQQHQQQQPGYVAGMDQSNLIQSPLSPLANNTALFGHNLIQHQAAAIQQNPGMLQQMQQQQQQQSGSPVVSPSTPPIVPYPASMPMSQPYPFPNAMAPYPTNNTTQIQPHINNATTTTYSNNNNNININNDNTNQLLTQQQQLQLLQQKQFLQQQIFQQQQQQHSNLTLNNTNFQYLPQGHNIAGMTPIATSSSPYIANNNIAQMQMTMTTPVVSSDFNPNVNTLPHTLPTTLNPSLKKKPVRNVLNSSDSMSPMSPRNGLFQDAWDIYEDYNTSGVGSSISSPISPGSSWSEYVIPRYDAPAQKDHCLKCNQKVYAMEKVGPIRDVLYHKNCFTCAACGTKLTLKNFHHNPNDMDDYNVFCASHKPRVVNIASEGNAYYVPKTSPRNALMDPSMQFPEAYNKAIAEAAIAEEAEEEEGYAEPRSVDEPDGNQNIGSGGIDQTTTGGGITSTNQQTKSGTTTATTTTPNGSSEDPATSKTVVVTQIAQGQGQGQGQGQSDTPRGSRKSMASNNSGSSPFSSVSSSSSYATSLKTEGTEDSDFKTKDNEMEFQTGFGRSDRPSSLSSVSTTSSTENLKTKVAHRDRKSSAEQQETSSIASNSSIERPDRPSSFLRSVSNTEQPCNKAIMELKKSGKMLVKSHSSQDFTHNNLKAAVDPRRVLTRNESMRMDRPSQYH